jgi:prolyl-tRNA editing enzyme YbaK/EbsC (Cys-tRNA(Pro) deacylase)
LTCVHSADHSSLVNGWATWDIGIANTKKGAHMSKSLKRVITALQATGTDSAPIEVGQATTAQMAADLVGCEIDQIAKSIIFRGEDSQTALLFVTAGGNQVDAEKASALAKEPLGKADAALIRAQTGFAIGGVSPIGHLNEPRAFFDPKLLEFETVWAAAGTPRHVFPIGPRTLLDISGAIEADFTVS